LVVFDPLGDVRGPVARPDSVVELEPLTLMPGSLFIPDVVLFTSALLPVLIPVVPELPPMEPDPLPIEVPDPLPVAPLELAAPPADPPAAPPADPPPAPPPPPPPPAAKAIAGVIARTQARTIDVRFIVAPFVITNQRRG